MIRRAASICVKAAKANGGELSVRNLPRKGCIFTLDLPRKPRPALSIVGGAGSESSANADAPTANEGTRRLNGGNGSGQACDFGASKRPSPNPLRSALRGSNGKKQSLHLSRGEATALVLDVEQNAVRGGLRGQANGAASMGELERVLKQVGNCRDEDLPIALDGHWRLDRHDLQVDTAGLSLHRGADLYLGHKVGDGDELEPLNPGIESHIYEGPIEEIAQGLLAVRREVADPALVVTEAVDNFRAQAAARGISLTAELVPVLPVASFDPARILRVLVNLRSNAIKLYATERQGRRRRRVPPRRVAIRRRGHRPGPPRR
jgi:hypothetical protein